MSRIDVLAIVAYVVWLLLWVAVVVSAVAAPSGWSISVAVISSVLVGCVSYDLIWRD